MSRSARIGGMVGLLGAVGAVGGARSLSLPTTVARPVPVVLIVLDTARRDHIGAYGYDRPTTPNIDAFAARATVYADAMAQSPWTTASMASLLSGRMPSALGIRDELQAVPRSTTLLAEHLHGRGYVTGAVVSNLYCSQKWGFSQGFDMWDQRPAGGLGNVSADRVTDSAIDFLSTHGDRPLFLLAHYMDPHVTYIEHDGFVFSNPDYDGALGAEIRWDDLRRRFYRMGEDDWQHVRDVYDSELAYTDHHVGRLLARLRDVGLYDDALIILTHDHGEEFKDHRLIGHGHSLYEELVGAPLIVKWPHQERGEVVHGVVGLVDIVPTVLDTLGVAVPKALVGQSLREPIAPERPMYAETERHGKDLRAVRIGARKLVWNGKRERALVFDLAEDPEERRAVPFDVEVHRDLGDALAAWPDVVLDSGELVIVDEDEQALLQALGYLQDEPEEEEE